MRDRTVVKVLVLYTANPRWIIAYGPLSTTSDYSGAGMQE